MSTRYEEIRGRLSQTESMLQGESMLSAERIQEILVARALTLSQAGGKESQEKTVVLLVFRLGDQCYAIQLVRVVEIQPFGRYAQVPGAPPFIKGVISVRGQIFTVIDLAVFFSVQMDDAARSSEGILIVEDSGSRVGLLVDQVIGISKYAPSEIHPVKLSLLSIKSEYLSGTTADSVAVLNLEELLSDRKLVVEDE